MGSSQLVLFPNGDGSLLGMKCGPVVCLAKFELLRSCFQAVRLQVRGGEVGWCEKRSAHLSRFLLGSDSCCKA